MGLTVGAGAEVKGCSSGKWTGKQIGEGERKKKKKNGGRLQMGLRRKRRELNIYGVPQVVHLS